MITLEHLQKLAPDSPEAPHYVEPLNEAMKRFGIDLSERRQASFIAQVIHESSGFRSTIENLNYSASALLAMWPKRFTPTLANEFGRTKDHAANQRMIANIAYADRLGNGPVYSGDGWIYRGRGPIQLTGKANYAACGLALNMDLLSDPDAVCEPMFGCLAAGWFWNEGNQTGKSLNGYADLGSIDRISRVINGGDNGLAARRSLYEQALKVLA